MITAQAARRRGRPRKGSAAVSAHPGPACRYCGRGLGAPCAVWPRLVGTSSPADMSTTVTSGCNRQRWRLSSVGTASLTPSRVPLPYRFFGFSRVWENCRATASSLSPRRGILRETNYLTAVSSGTRATSPQARATFLGPGSGPDRIPQRARRATNPAGAERFTRRLSDHERHCFDDPASEINVTVESDVSGGQGLVAGVPAKSQSPERGLLHSERRRRSRWRLVHGNGPASLNPDRLFSAQGTGDPDRHGCVVRRSHLLPHRVPHSQKGPLQ